ncbi:MAG: hypothetical protein HKP14_00855 [Bacteroidia bacterium]|nr:hypothetical protein [Bacteroidia bacterium]
MNFQNPNFLWALFLVAIPIVIHLFNFRKYKKVIFSNVQMLKHIQTESKKTRQIKKWLVLATRILAISALVFAFARPYIPLNGVSQGANLVSVYLDNSQSMNAEGEDGQLFENSKNLARELIGNLPPESKVQIIDNTLSPFSNKLQSTSNAIKIIDDMDITFHPNDLSKVLQRVNNVYVSNDFSSQQTIAISDFQNNGLPQSALIDSNIQLNFLQVEPVKLQNLSIDSAWLSEPISRAGEPVKLKVRVVNNGTDRVESSSMVLKINEVQQGIESFSLDGNSELILDVAFTPSTAGWIEGELSIDDVPVVFDNNYYFTILVKKSINVLQVGSASNEIRKIFENDASFNLKSTSSSSIDFGSLESYDFIVLNGLSEITSGLAEQLKQFVSKGGNLLVIPSEKKPDYSFLETALGTRAYGSLQQKDLSIRSADLKHPFFKGVYSSIPRNILLPKIAKCYELSPASNSQNILQLKDGTAVLSKTFSGQGAVYQFALPLNKSFSNFSNHELLVLTMLNMSFSTSNKQQIAYNLFHPSAINVSYFSGSESNLSLQKDDNNIFVESSLGGGRLKFWLNETISDAGLYDIVNTAGDSIAKVALNNTRLESKQDYFESEELKGLFPYNQVVTSSAVSASVKNITSSLASGKALWKIFILLSLIFLLMEILLLRFLKS